MKAYTLHVKENSDWSMIYATADEESFEKVKNKYLEKYGESRITWFVWDERDTEEMLLD